MINQRDVDKILMTKSKSKIIKPNESTFLQKPKNIDEALTEQTRFVKGTREKGEST